MANEYAMQNGRVWARRMEVECDLVQLEKFLDTNFPGSVLVGPLTAVMCRYYKASISGDDDRRVAAGITATALAAVLREQYSGNVLALLAQIAQGDAVAVTVFAKYSNVMTSAIAVAIAARTAEKNRPSLANMIAMHIRRRR